MLKKIHWARRACFSDSLREIGRPSFTMNDVDNGAVHEGQMIWTVWGADELSSCPLLSQDSIGSSETSINTFIIEYT